MKDGRIIGKDVKKEILRQRRLGEGDTVVSTRLAPTVPSQLFGLLGKIKKSNDLVVVLDESNPMKSATIGDRRDGIIVAMQQDLDRRTEPGENNRKRHTTIGSNVIINWTTAIPGPSNIKCIVGI